MLEIIMSKEADDFLAKIPKKHAQQIVKKIDTFAEDQTAVPTKQLISCELVKGMMVKCTDTLKI